MQTRINLYTIQLSKRRLLEGRDIELLDITVKSGDKLFAPEWEWVMASKRDPTFENTYVDLYRAKMRESYKANKQHWLDSMSSDIALGCYCPSGGFCHRHLLATYFKAVAEKHGINIILSGEIN